MNNSNPETLLETINFDYSNYEQTTNLLRFTDWLSTKYRRPTFNYLYTYTKRKIRTIYSQTIATITKFRETSSTV
jgi:hypothetical protein